jgi:hypothetical protein
MLTLDMQDLASVKVDTMDHPESTMCGHGFATLRLELVSTQGDTIRLTLFGKTPEDLMSTLEKALQNATMASYP